MASAPRIGAFSGHSHAGTITASGAKVASQAALSRRSKASTPRRMISTFSCDIAFAVSRLPAHGEARMAVADPLGRKPNPLPESRVILRFLLREPQGFEGLPFVAEECHSNNLAVAEKEVPGDRELDWNPA